MKASTDFVPLLNQEAIYSSDVGFATTSEMKKKRSYDYMSDDSSSASSVQSMQSMKRSRPTVDNCTDTKVKPSSVGIKAYNENDVLSGRGGGTNQHDGNCYFRALINKNREQYLRAKKNDKPFISLSIVSAIRQRNGRFLKNDEKSGLWFEIGDDAAREKTSQALRQRAPEYRKQLLERDTKSLQELSNKTTHPSISTMHKALKSMHSQSPSGRCAIPNKEVMLLAISASLRQAQLEEAQRALRLQQKLNSIKLLEFILNSNLN